MVPFVGNLFGGAMGGVNKLAPLLIGGHGYLSYMLGDYVMGLGAKDASGTSMAHPPWSLVISYEHAIRSKAMNLVKKGATLKDALKQAWEDPITKERYFTTPLCLESSRKRPAEGQAEGRRHEPAPRHTQKGGSKGSNKGSGKAKRAGKGAGGKGSNKVQGCASKTPDGRDVFNRFNNDQNRCESVKCRFAHVCGVCFAKGVPMHSCLHAK